MSIGKYILLPYGYTLRLSDGEDGYIIASCPQLPGCHAQGEDVESALSNIEDAVIGYLAVLEEENGTIPIADATVTASPHIADATEADDPVWAAVA